MSTSTDVTAVTYHFDPACPWTWRTSRWLLDVTGRNGLPLSYRAFELSDGAPLDAVPEQYRAAALASRSLLRVVEAAHARDDDDLIADFYTAYGTAVHDGKGDPSRELIEEALVHAGGQGYLAALDDAGLDDAVAASRRAAQAFAGDDAGSPVIVVSTPDGERGFFGPVLAPTPSGADADRLWQVVTAFAALPQVFEIKRRRDANP
ncbi:MAG TPA: hypothetical protein VHZ02_15675 [Acidimicrobiales bacterium]|nr:hypothetical protein [Acidimicrobiales bacterium]